MKSVKLLSMAMLCMAVAFTSCSGEDGEQGPPGANGVDGTDGQDGQDGNANVSHVVIDMTEYTGTLFSANVPELTEDVIAKDGILYYLEVQDLSEPRYFSIPGSVSGDFMTQVYVEAQALQIIFMNYDGTGYPITANDNLQSLRIVMIESNIASKSSTAEPLGELKAAGVDVGDYNAVAAYFGLD